MGQISKFPNSSVNVMQWGPVNNATFLPNNNVVYVMDSPAIQCQNGYFIYSWVHVCPYMEGRQSALKPTVKLEPHYQVSPIFTLNNKWGRPDKRLVNGGDLVRG